MDKPEIRKAYFLNKYVIIAPNREKRPREIIEKSIENTIIDCVFCPENIEKDLLIKTYGKSGKNWKIAVLKNKFPLVTTDNSKSYGWQEVIIESPDHGVSFSDLNDSAICDYLKVMADRLKEITKNKKIEFVLQFKNEGSKAGATIKHSHSQIFATSMIPYDVFDELKLAENYLIEHGSCAYCDIFSQELKSPRLIFNDGLIGAIAPFASEFHYEAWIFPLRHTDNIATLTPKELKSLASCLKQITKKIKSIGLAYNFYMNQVVSHNNQHFQLKIQPRDNNVWAGIELGSGIVVNSVSPEKAAAFYREKPKC